MIAHTCSEAPVHAPLHRTDSSGAVRAAFFQPGAAISLHFGYKLQRNCLQGMINRNAFNRAQDRLLQSFLPRLDDLTLRSAR